MTAPGPRLWLVTNAHDPDALEEDAALARALGPDFRAELCPVEDAPARLALVPRALVRNAWPGRRFAALGALARAHEEGRARLYNPPRRGGYVEDKRYLRDLHAEGMDVPPTALTPGEARSLPPADRYVVKPLDGCSSAGLRWVTRPELLADDLAGALAQPALALVEEVSFF